MVGWAQFWCYRRRKSQSYVGLTAITVFRQNGMSQLFSFKITKCVSYQYRLKDYAFKCDLFNLQTLVHNKTQNFVGFRSLIVKLQKFDLSICICYTFHFNLKTIKQRNLSGKGIKKSKTVQTTKYARIIYCYLFFVVK